MTALLAIDQGTTTSRAILFSKDGKILDIRQKELPLHYPQKGWVEQNPNDIWKDTLWAVTDLIEKNSDTKISAIGITNQRETTIIWDRETGIPVYNAIVWQDRRTAEYCNDLKISGYEPMITQKTGLLLDPYFSATKIKWILDHVDGAREKAKAGRLAFGTIDCFLLWHLTNGTQHKTDASNAARTMLCDAITGEWDDDLLNLFDIPRAILPQITDNISDFGVAEIAGRSLPIGGMAGDQQAALIGQACFETGMVKSTYGTGCFALMNIGKDFVPSQNCLLTTIAYQIKGRRTYALEGSIFTAGAAIQWLRDNLGFFDHASESEALALSVPDHNDVYFVPAFTGLGAPYWNPFARAIITGLTRDSTKAHITRAALEAQGYQTADLMNQFARDAATPIRALRIDGGLAQNHFVCQFLADILDCPIEVPKVIETTAWGAACLAGLHTGIFGSPEEIARTWNCHKTFKPVMTKAQRQSLLNGWHQAIALLTNP